MYEEIVPIISSITPLNTYVNVNTVFSIFGSDLPSTLALYIPNCMYLTNLSKSSTLVEFSCTPTGVGGSENGLIKDKVGGLILETFTITATVTAFNLSLLQGVWKNNNYYYYFTNNGFYTVYYYTNSCYRKNVGYQFRQTNEGSYQLYKDNQKVGETATMDINNNIWTVTNTNNANSVFFSRENLFVDTFENNLCN